MNQVSDTNDMNGQEFLRIHVISAPGSMSVALAVPAVLARDRWLDDARIGGIDERDVQPLARVSPGRCWRVEDGRAGRLRARPKMTGDGISDERAQLLIIH
jgi:hypothetical protein